MKTTNMLPLLYAFALLFLAPANTFAQKEQKVEKEEYRIKIVRDLNGEKQTFDTTFHSKEELEQFNKEMMAKAKEYGFDNIGEKLKGLSSDSINKLLMNKSIQVDWKGKDGFENIEVIMSDSALAGENIVMQHFEIDEDIKEKMLDAGTNKELVDMIKSLNIDIDVDSLIDENGTKNVRMIAVFRRIELEDAPKSLLQQNAHPKMQSAANDDKLDVNSINVYPNPSNGKVFLELEPAQKGEVELLVTDIQGKEIFRDSFYNDALSKVHRNINIDGERSGVYLLKVTSQGKSVVKKLIIEK